mgnify:CR=1 FL=1
MKKILKFFSSMKFGMLLLLLLLAVSFVGSLITQGGPRDYYLAEYAEWGELLLWLKLDSVFASWYFVSLVSLLCVSLIFCSVSRFGATGKICRAMPLAAAKAEAREIAADQAELEAFVKARRFRPLKTPEGEVWAKNLAGHYGSFVVHLSLLLLLLCASAVLFLSSYQDVTLHPGESVKLDVDVQLHLDSFRAADDDGAVEYASRLAVQDAEGNLVSGEIRVNYPMYAAGLKLYQYACGTEGRLTVSYGGQDEALSLTADDEESFFSVDDENGLVYYGLYPNYILGEDGSAEPILDDSKGYVNPIYAVVLIDGGEQRVGLVLPGETLSAGGIEFTFGQPAEFSVIRVKTFPAGALGLLYFSFALLIFGLWLCFFHVPVYIKIGPGGAAIRSPKPDTGYETALRLLEKEVLTRHA